MFKKINAFIYYLFRKSFNIEKNYLGVNSFFNQNLFGYSIHNNEIRHQSIEIIEELNIKIIRVLFSYKSDDKNNIDFSFYDSIIMNIPKNLKVLIVLSGAPDWIIKNTQYEYVNNRQFFQEFCKLCIIRYSNYENIVGFQIGNEVNSNIDNNQVYNFSNVFSYLEVLIKLSSFIKEFYPTKLVVCSATSSILQKNPETLIYNQALLEYQQLKVFDIFSIHWYGRTYIELFKSNGIFDFLNKITTPIWITEIGNNNSKNHIIYFQQSSSFLLKYFANIQKIFWYQYDGGGDTITFGLRTKNGISPLLEYLKKYYDKI